MIDLNEILRIQPKTQLKFHYEDRFWFFEKAPKIDYGSRPLLDEIQVETTLSELKRLTRLPWRCWANQYLPERWTNGGFTEEEFQLNFDETIYEQQLTQRLGRGKLTQTPQLEWVSLQEASDIYGVNYKVVNRWIREGRLNVLQRKKGYRKLIQLDENFFFLAFCYLKGSFDEINHRIFARVRILKFEPKTDRYRAWKLPLTLLERIYPVVYTKKRIRAVLAKKIHSSHFQQLSRCLHEGELKKYHSPRIEMDTRYCSILRTRRKALYLGRPPLRYFTTEEAAFYLRVSKQVIIKAVKVGQLTPLKTETGIHFFYEKKTLLQYAGPSTNPFEIDESSVQTREVVEQQHMSEFSNHLPSNSKSRIFLSEMDIKFEEYKIKKAFNQICEVSLDHRANNLHYYNFTFHPEAAKFCGNKILQEIERYIPPPTKAKPRKKRCKR